MSNYLKNPSIRPNVSVIKGDKLREGQEVEMHLAKPLASNADVLAKTADLEMVEVPDPKVLNVKDKKNIKLSSRGSLLEVRNLHLRKG